MVRVGDLGRHRGFCIHLGPGIQGAGNHEEPVFLDQAWLDSPRDQDDPVFQSEHREPGTGFQMVTLPQILGDHEAAGTINGNFSFHDTIHSTMASKVGPAAGRGADPRDDRG